MESKMISHKKILNILYVAGITLAGSTLSYGSANPSQDLYEKVLNSGQLTNGTEIVADGQRSLVTGQSILDSKPSNFKLAKQIGNNTIFVSAVPGAKTKVAITVPIPQPPIKLLGNSLLKPSPLN